MPIKKQTGSSSGICCNVQFSSDALNKSRHSSSTYCRMTRNDWCLLAMWADSYRTLWRLTRANSHRTRSETYIDFWISSRRATLLNRTLMTSFDSSRTQKPRIQTPSRNACGGIQFKYVDCTKLSIRMRRKMQARRSTTGAYTRSKCVFIQENQQLVRRAKLDS